MTPRAYDIYIFAKGEQKQWVGGAPDIQSATVLAGAFITFAQQLYPTVGAGVGVIQSSGGEIVAYVGWETPPV